MKLGMKLEHALEDIDVAKIRRSMEAREKLKSEAFENGDQGPGRRARRVSPMQAANRHAGKGRILDIVA